MVLLTFGLLSPNKGIEHVLNALPAILAEFPDVVYIVLGATHPNVVREQGEAYRLSLERLAKKNKVQKNVIFYNRFVELGRTQGVHRRGGHLYHAVSATRRRSRRARWPTPLAPAKPWSRPRTGTRRNCWRKTAACWCRSLTRQPSRARCIGLLRDEMRRHAIRKNAYKLGREMVWSNVARLYMRSFELRPGSRARCCRARPLPPRPSTSAARIAGVQARPSVADDRLDRHVPARHFHGAEFLRRLLHG